MLTKTIRGDTLTTSKNTANDVKAEVFYPENVLVRTGRSLKGLSTWARTGKGPKTRQKRMIVVLWRKTELYTVVLLHKIWVNFIQMTTNSWWPRTGAGLGLHVIALKRR